MKIQADVYQFDVKELTATKIIAVDNRGRTVSFDGTVFIGLSGKPCKRIPKYGNTLIALMNNCSAYDSEEDKYLGFKLTQLFPEEAQKRHNLCEVLPKETRQLADTLTSMLLSLESCGYITFSLRSFNWVLRTMRDNKYEWFNVRNISKAMANNVAIKTFFSQHLQNKDSVVLTVLALFGATRPNIPVATASDEELISLLYYLTQLPYWKRGVQRMVSPLFVIRAVKSHFHQFLPIFFDCSQDARTAVRAHTTAQTLCAYWDNCEIAHMEPTFNNLLKGFYHAKLAADEVLDEERRKALAKRQTGKVLQFSYGDWHIEAPTTHKEFVRVGDAMNNCFGTWAYEEALNGHGFYGVVMDSDGKAVACIEVSAAHMWVRQFYGKGNKPLSKDSRAMEFKDAYNAYLRML